MQIWTSVRIVTIASILCVAADAHAQFFRSWIDANGGSYGDPFNWSPSGVPDADDGAGFSVNETYIVTFPSNETTGVVTVSNGFVSFFMGSSGTNRTLAVPGTLTVTGAGILSVRDGEVGPGNIMVSNGGELTVMSTATVIAPDGTATVTGSGSTWIHDNPIIVGDSGDGVLQIEAGGDVSSDLPAEGSFSGVIAAGGASTGDVTVTGAGSSWTNFGGLSVGNGGEGTLTISDGGSVSNALDGSIATLPGSIGEVTVAGPASTWTSSGALFNVGDQGAGTLNITGGGIVNSGTANISRIAGSVSTATVDGDDSLWSIIGSLGVGTRGDGTLNITGGGDVENTDGFVGSLAGSMGTASVSGEGSTWTNSGELRVGNSGTGDLMIEAAGSVSNGLGTLAANPGSTGTVTVTGAGSTWTNGVGLVVGGSGNGTLTISNGGSVGHVSGSSAVHHIGFDSGSTGTVTVTGVGSTSTHRHLLVGESGNGELTISDGGAVSSAFGILGENSGSTGTVAVVNPGSMWSNTFDIQVGSQGEGELRISFGAVSSRRGTIGFASTGTGSVLVTGTGATWTNSEFLVVGHSGIGTLAIAFGGSVQNGTATIGGSSGSSGTVTVGGSGSTWTNNGQLSIGGRVETGLNGGAGTLTSQPGGTVNVTQDIVLFDDGIVKLEGGALATTRFDFRGGQFQWTAGTLNIEIFDGDLTNPIGGTLAPGQSAGGTTVLGDYTQQDGATLQIEIGGLATATEHDFVNVTGTALLGGELELSLINGFVPSPDDELIVFNAAAPELLGFFTNAGNGQRVDTVDGLGSFVVHYGPTSTFDPNQIVLSDFIRACPADIDRDGTVDVIDLLAVLGGWGACEAPCPPACAADTNGDCAVDVLDLLAVLGAWGSCF